MPTNLYQSQSNNWPIVAALLHVTLSRSGETASNFGYFHDFKTTLWVETRAARYEEDMQYAIILLNGITCDK